jgi:ribonuclease HII
LNKKKESITVLRLIKQKFNPLYAGVDEVGRGCLAGKVTVCALILKNNSLNDILNDSKKLSKKQRDILYPKIIEIADYRIVSLDVQEIDRLNILQATLKAMALALDALKPIGAYIDGNKTPKTQIPCEAIIGGDGLVPQISAASIIAKVTRDNDMIELAKHYPEYGFDNHKGYGTKEHLAAIEKYGITPHHRLSFAPIRQACLAF